MERKSNDELLVPTDEPASEALGSGADEMDAWPNTLKFSMTLAPNETPNDTAAPESEASVPLGVADDLRYPPPRSNRRNWPWCLWYLSSPPLAVSWAKADEAASTAPATAERQASYSPAAH